VAVDQHAAVAQAQPVARQTDDALDQMQRRIDGIMKDDNVAVADEIRRRKSREAAGGDFPC